MSVGTTAGRLPITVLLAVKNEAANLPRCLGALRLAERVVVLDSHSTDETPEFAKRFGAEETIRPRLFGSSQERRRAIKSLIVRMPFEHWRWFVRF